MVTPHLPWKFHANRSSRFLVMLLTKKQTKKQRNRSITIPRPPTGDGVIRQKSKVLVTYGHSVCCMLHLLAYLHLRVLFAGMTNALAFRPFHELSVYQRVWIVKSLCDYCAVCICCALGMLLLLSVSDCWHDCNCTESYPPWNRGILHICVGVLEALCFQVVRLYVLRPGVSPVSAISYKPVDRIPPNFGWWCIRG